MAVEVVESGNGEAKTTRNEFRRGGDGRSTLTIDQIENGKTRRVWETRSDGRRLFQAIHFKDETQAIDRVVVRAAMNTPETYRGPLFDALHAVMPVGQSIRGLLGREDSLSWDGEGRLRLSGSFQGFEFVCELDPDNDDMPKSVEIRRPTSINKIVVDAFEPGGLLRRPSRLSAVFEIKREEKTSTGVAQTRVEEFVFNETMPKSLFEFGSLPAGVLLEDRIKGTETIVGGLLARTELVDAHATPKPKPEPESTTADRPAGPSRPEPIQASVNPPRSLLSPVLFALAALTAVVGFVIRFRRSS